MDKDVDLLYVYIRGYVTMNEDLNKIIDRYTDKNDKFSYDLMNKELITFAHRSKVVKKKIAEKEKIGDIVFYIVSNKFRNIAKDPHLSDERIKEMIDELDALYAKGITKDLAKELRKMSHGGKRDA